ncbi:unnamed protein product [Nezara viridula]|uniref:Uncharacterized protein n=1 Tax=Nezara viridula TaxID=85310 RepID=A0A9P0HP47_NEZVI|nr:unnamed protein product [Nezara viridula]
MSAKWTMEFVQIIFLLVALIFLQIRLIHKIAEQMVLW